MTPLIKCEMRWKRKMMMMKVMERDVDEGRRGKAESPFPPFLEEFAFLPL